MPIVFRGTVAPWHRGTVAPWHRGNVLETTGSKSRGREFITNEERKQFHK